VIIIGDKKELILVSRKPRARYWTCICFGTKRHYRVDGTCKHTAEILAKLAPEYQGKVRVEGWGGKPPEKSDAP
jgi:hypothetical protein